MFKLFKGENWLIVVLVVGLLAMCGVSLIYMADQALLTQIWLAYRTAIIAAIVAIVVSLGVSIIAWIINRRWLRKTLNKYLE